MSQERGKQLFVAGVALVIVIGVVVGLTRDDSDAGVVGEPRAAAGPLVVPGPPRPATPPSRAERRRERRARDRAIERAVGQKIVVRYRGRKPSAELLSAVRKGKVGGVILFRDNVLSLRALSRAIDRLQRAARSGGNPPLLVMIDQEGGDVRRIATIPPTLSPRGVGRTKDPGLTGLAEGAATASALRELGINVNLAPVADVASPKASWLGRRAFGTSPALVARAACGFATGLMRGGVAPAFKHFPGLGRATGNTDDRPVVVRATARRLVRDQLPYRRCAPQLPIIMVSSATYLASRSSAPAVLTPEVYRRSLPAFGFAGVTVSDDLETPALAGNGNVTGRAVRAGLDLLLFARSEGGAYSAYSDLVRDIRKGRLDPQRVLVSAGKISALKRRYAVRPPSRRLIR